MCMEIEDWTFLLFNFNGQIWGGDMNLADVEMFVNCWFAHRNDGIKPISRKVFVNIVQVVSCAACF